jgi:hypothetical protein
VSNNLSVSAEPDVIGAPSPVPSLRRDASNQNLNELEVEFFDPDYDFDGKNSTKSIYQKGYQ